LMGLMRISQIRWKTDAVGPKADDGLPIPVHRTISLSLLDIVSGDFASSSEVSRRWCVHVDPSHASRGAAMTKGLFHAFGCKRKRFSLRF